MIKPKYKKGMDFSQIARSAVEYAVQVPLTPSSEVNPAKYHLDDNKQTSSKQKTKKSF
jgi:hypothetical protein